MLVIDGCPLGLRAIAVEWMGELGATGGGEIEPYALSFELRAIEAKKVISQPSQIRMLARRLVWAILRVMQTINCTREDRFGGGKSRSIGGEDDDLASFQEFCEIALQLALTEKRLRADSNQLSSGDRYSADKISAAVRLNVGNKGDAIASLPR